MAVSKKIRFEVFKRDGFQCAYCGKKPPAVILEVDHIQPKSKKGKDDINNLITACFDCNRGKTNIPLSKIPPKISENLEVLKEQEEQIIEYRKFIKKIERRINKDIEDVNTIFSSFFPEKQFSDDFKQTSVKKFLSLLPKDEVILSLKTAADIKQGNADTAIKYFCGICWRKIKGDSPENKIIME